MRMKGYSVTGLIPDILSGMRDLFTLRGAVLACLFVAAAGCMAPTSGSEKGAEARGSSVVAAPPGAPAYDKALGRRLAKAFAARGPAYEPRTHHLNPDGSACRAIGFFWVIGPVLLIFQFDEERGVVRRFNGER